MNKYQKELLKSYRAFKTSYLENEDKVYLDFKKFKKNYSKCRFSINEMEQIRLLDKINNKRERNIMRYEVKDVVCDYGVYEEDKLIVICNKKENAEIIKQTLEADLKNNRVGIIEKNEAIQKRITKLGFSLGVWAGYTDILTDEIGYIKDANKLEELEELRESIEGIKSAMDRAKELINEIYEINK